jgi:serine/threonine-protein kinase
MRCLEKHPADRPQSAAEVVHVLDDITTPSGGSMPTAALPAVPSRSTTRPVVLAVSLLAVVAVGAAGLMKLRGGGAAAPVRSIAVLPFEIPGGDTAGAYFADGMRDEIATALGKVPTISVASRTSSYAFRAKSGVTPQEIGKQLGVDAILEGTVRRSGDQLRVSAQLTRASTGLGLWSDSYNRRMTDVFTVQEDLAKAIASTLGAAVRGGASGTTLSVAKSRGTENQAAYDLYLRGRYLLNGRNALPRALSYFEGAAHLDTNFAQAFAAAATVYSLTPFYEGADGRDAARRAQQSARRALALDSALAEAHAAMAFGFVLNFAWAEAEREFQRALAIDSLSAQTYGLYGYMLNGIGRRVDALRVLEHAARLDPLAPTPTFNYGYLLALSGQVDSAIAVGLRMRETDPGSLNAGRLLGRAYRVKGDLARGIAELESAARDPGAWPDLVVAYVQAGRRRDADSVRAIIERRATTGGRFADVATAYLALGDKPQALRWLERAIDRYDGGILSMRLFDVPEMKPLREDPDFTRLVARLGITR